MAKVRILRQSLRFIDDNGITHELKKGAVPDPELDETHLDHWFVKAHIESGNIVVVANPNSVEISIDDMTVSQLKGAISAIKPDFSFEGLKKRQDFAEALRTLKGEAEANSGDNG